MFPSSAASSPEIKVNKYSLLSHIYFFFNSVLLPKGMLYTQLLSPLFFFNALNQKRKTYLVHFSIFLFIYDCIHLVNGVDLFSFLLSNAMFILTYFSVITFYHFINNYQGLGKIFKQILLFNAGMALIALPFFFTPYREAFWYLNKLTVGLEAFPRLALFTYEASYYSLLLIPIVYYYVLKFFFKQIDHNRWLTLALAVVPMLLSLSFGVLGATCMVMLIMALMFAKKLFRYKRPFIVITSLLTIMLLALVILLVYYPDNVLFVRIENILAGKDTSANGRTTDSFSMAWRIIELKNIFFGVGLGQIKFMAVEVAHAHYKYWGTLNRYDIPNAMGETLAIFGLAGILLRLFLEIWLFFKTKVYSNYYRLALFLFIFVYQFTGSFITNIVEYVIWILAFSQVFTQFDVQPKTGKNHV